MSTKSPGVEVDALEEALHPGPDLDALHRAGGAGVFHPVRDVLDDGLADLDLGRRRRRVLISPAGPEDVAAVPAAVLCLVLWEAARELFGSILLHSRAFGLLSGGVAGTVAFLLWIYTGVAIVLLGAEWAALVNGDRPGGRSGRTGTDGAGAAPRRA